MLLRVVRTYYPNTLVSAALLPNDLVPTAQKQSDGRRECGLSSVLAMKGGERGRNRTYNLLIKSQLLCQLSYAPTVEILRWDKPKIIAC